MGYLHSEITDRVICSFYNAYNDLGYGFLEKVYENALFQEISDLGIPVFQQEPVSVEFKGKVVGSYQCDLLVNNQVIVEIKAVKKLLPEH